MGEQGQVYVISAVGTNLYKIGYTSKSPEERMLNIQTSSPHELEVVFSAPGTRETEKKAHEHFSDCRDHGEWFCFENGVPKLKIRELACPETPELWQASDLDSARILTKEEERQIRQECVDRGRYKELSIIIIGLYAGCLTSEVTELEVGDVFNEDGGFSKRITMKHKGMYRSFPLVDTIKVPMKKYLDEERDGWAADDPLFLSKRGGAFDRSSIWHLLQRVCKWANVEPVKFESLRRTFGWRVYRNHGLEAARLALGHADFVATVEFLDLEGNDPILSEEVDQAVHDLATGWMDDEE